MLIQKASLHTLAPKQPNKSGAIGKRAKMKILSKRSVHEVSQFVTSHPKHSMKLKSYSDDSEESSEFEANLTPQEMRRVLNFIQDLQNKSYSLE